MLDFEYNGNNYVLLINSNDPSGVGCVEEIVNRDEYNLSKFVNLKGGIIDIGANCGVATIILAKQNPNAIIYSYEPHLPTYNLLVKNVKSNNLTNVKTFNLAVSDAKKVVKLFESPLCSGGNTTCSDNTTFTNHFNSQIIPTTVNAISLDDIIIDNAIKSVDVLKIDCEGAEFQIIPSSLFFKLGIVKNMVGEFHDLIYNTQVSNDSERLVEYCRNYVLNLNISILKI